MNIKSFDMYFMCSERIGFRKWTKEDLELAVNLWGDSEVTKYFDARGRLSRDQVRDRLKNEIEMEEKYGVQYWPIFLKDRGDHIGACGLRPYDIQKRIFETGFHLCSSFWGKGLATEAALKVMDFAFNELKAEGLFAGHNPKNKASRHLLKKLGFEYLHDEYYEPTGLMHPSYLLSPNAYASLNNRAAKP